MSSEDYEALQVSVTELTNILEEITSILSNDQISARSKRETGDDCWSKLADQIETLIRFLSESFDLYQFFSSSCTNELSDESQFCLNNTLVKNLYHLRHYLC